MHCVCGWGTCVAPRNLFIGISKMDPLWRKERNIIDCLLCYYQANRYEEKNRIKDQCKISTVSPKFKKLMTG